MIKVLKNTYAAFLKYLNLEFIKYYNNYNFEPNLLNATIITLKDPNDNFKILTEGINILKLWINHDENMSYDLPVNWTDEVTLIEKKYTKFAIYAITSKSKNLWNESGEPVVGRRGRLGRNDSNATRSVKSISTTDLKVGQPQKTADKWVKDFLIQNAYSKMLLEFVPCSNDELYNHERVMHGRMITHENELNIDRKKERFLEANDVETIVYFLNPNVLFEKGVNLIKTVIKVDGFRIPVEFCVNLD